MSSQLQLRRGSAVSNSVFTGAVGELTYSTDTHELISHDGATEGGFPGGGFMPGGTGAVTTAIQTKLRESVSVKDFGAVGDGVTDDTAAITAAFTYAGSTGQKLSAPDGTYLLSISVTWAISNGFEIECAPSVTFKAAASMPVDAKLFYPSASSGSQKFVWYGGTIDGRLMPARSSSAPDLLYVAVSHIKDVIIDGVSFICNDTRAGTAGDSCLFLAEGEDYKVVNCRFQGPIDAGVYISGDSAQTLGRRAVVTNNTFIECKAVGVISKRSFEDHIVSNNIFVKCGIGVVIGGESDVSKLPGKKAVIANNIVRQCTRGIEVRISDGTIVSGNRIEDYGLNESLLPSSGAGIRVMGSNNCSVTGNTLFINSTITPAAGAAAISCQRYSWNAIDYDSKQNLISNNNVKNARTAFNEDSNANENIWLGNYVKTYTTYFTLNANTSSRFVGWDGERQTNYFGDSGIGAVSIADVFYENDSELNFQYCVPSTHQIQWLVGDEASNTVGRCAYRHTTDRWAWRAGGSAIDVFQVGVSGPILATYTVATLPSTGLATGLLSYATNGRKAGEGAGLGTGVLVFRDGSNWIAVDSGLPVTA